MHLVRFITRVPGALVRLVIGLAAGAVIVIELASRKKAWRLPKDAGDREKAKKEGL